MNDHTHPGDAAHLEVQKAVTSLKERAANTQDSTGQVVAAAVANLSQAGQGAPLTLRSRDGALLTALYRRALY